MCLGMIRLPLEDDEEPRHQSCPPLSVIDHLLERLPTAFDRLDSTVGVIQLVASWADRSVKHDFRHRVLHRFPQ